MNVTSELQNQAGDERVVADALFGTLYAELHRLARRELNRRGPGGLGVTDGSLQLQLISLAKTDESVATAMMILVRLATLWFAVLVGFVSLSIMKRRHPGLLRTTAAPAEASDQVTAREAP